MGEETLFYFFSICEAEKVLDACTAKGERPSKLVHDAVMDYVERINHGDIPVPEE